MVDEIMGEKTARNTLLQVIIQKMKTKTMGESANKSHGRKNTAPSYMVSKQQYPHTLPIRDKRISY